uniref:Uncharacterized protein n=1 Tax=Octopus bimaculoides TaxID=37653 RepID=A0A0L8GKD3_OCTBM
MEPYRRFSPSQQMQSTAVYLSYNVTPRDNFINVYSQVLNRIHDYIIAHSMTSDCTLEKLYQ